MTSLNGVGRVIAIVPTYNGGAIWKQCAQALAAAKQASGGRLQVLVVDSSSADDTVQVAKSHGFEVQVINSSEFDHGGTRNWAAFRALERCAPGVADASAPYEAVVFLTQDAVLAQPTSIETLVDAFSDPLVAVAYGRQLPHENANPIAVHARLFNYGAGGRVVGLEDAPSLGLKTVFTSNAFCAYRSSVFCELGGFPEKTILSEDMYFAARAVAGGHKVAYVADAAVKHSHNYSPLEEFKRYFDIGVFQSSEDWIARQYGGAGGEGRRFLMSEIRYLLKHAPVWIPRAALHNALKIVGYKLGKNYRALSPRTSRRLSLHPRYWDTRAND